MRVVRSGATVAPSLRRGAAEAKRGWATRRGEVDWASAMGGGVMRWRLALIAFFCVMGESGSTSELEDARCGDTTSARPGMTMVRPM